LREPAVRSGFFSISGWFFGAAACLSCDPAGPLITPVADAATQVPIPGAVSAPPALAPPPSAPAATEQAPLQILRLTLTSDVRNKEPVDKLDKAVPGRRVYAHLAMRNRSGKTRQIHLSFEVNGNLRTSLDLDVEPSWSYRTWGYNTVLASDTKGELTLVVTDDQGEELARARLPIRR
jgi:hypothetical protein